MKKFKFIFVFGAVCALALTVRLPSSPSETIAHAATFVDQLERAKRIDRDTTYPIQKLVASLHDIGPQANAGLEARRAATLARLQTVLLKASRKHTMEAQALGSEPSSADK